jgi:outer membrane beta-barrel protein
MRLTIAVVALLVGAPSLATAQEERPTVQRRFARKQNSVYAHVTGTAHIRNDFYDSFGAGADLGWYPWESFGVEVRALFLETRLSAAAQNVKERTGLTPDARPQGMVFTAGGRWSFGYGKILALKKFVMHFDPQLTVTGGVARAERRILPTAITSLSLLTHFRWGIQVKLDLGTTIQMEKRTDRGWVPTLGFLPVLGVGWNWSFASKDG